MVVHIYLNSFIEGVSITDWALAVIQRSILHSGGVCLFKHGFPEGVSVMDWAFAVIWPY